MPHAATEDKPDYLQYFFDCRVNHLLFKCIIYLGVCSVGGFYFHHTEPRGLQSSNVLNLLLLVA